MLPVSYIQQYLNTSITVLTKVADCTVQSAEYWCFYSTSVEIPSVLKAWPCTNITCLQNLEL